MKIKLAYFLLLVHNKDEKTLFISKQKYYVDIFGKIRYIGKRELVFERNAILLIITRIVFVHY